MWLDFVLKYWAQVLFGAIVAILAGFHKKLKAKWEEYRNAHDKEKRQEFVGELVTEIKPIIEEVATRSDENDEKICAEIATISHELVKVKGGMLSIQGDDFKHKCRSILNTDSKITLEQWEELQRDHTAYNALGGNHEGDALFALIQKKYENQL